MNRRRVVITGMGVVSPVGNNVETAWNNVKNGVSGLGNISLFDSSRLKVHVDAEVKNFNIEDYGISSRATRKMARFSKFCLAASAQAIEDAGYTKETLQAEKTGVLLGCCIGGMDATSDAFKKLFEVICVFNSYSYFKAAPLKSSFYIIHLILSQKSWHFK